MEQKLTNEEIAKVFAMYLGQYVVHDDGEIAHLVGVVDTSAHLIHLDTHSYGNGSVDYVKLLLTPLSAITDEHAVEVAKIICDRQYIDIENLITSWESTIKSGNIYRISFNAYQITRFPNDKPRKHIILITTWGTVNHYIETELGNCTRAHNVFQYLISKGYAVPLFLGIDHWANGKTAIELGIAINKK